MSRRYTQSYHHYDGFTISIPHTSTIIPTLPRALGVENPLQVPKRRKDPSVYATVEEALSIYPSEPNPLTIFLKNETRKSKYTN